MKENILCDRFDHERDRISRGNMEPEYDFNSYTVTSKAVGIINNTQFPAGDISNRTSSS